MSRNRGILAILIFGAVYEVSFRLCTARWGEINTETRPVSLYYSQDSFLPGQPLIKLFNWRANLPLGRVRLAEGTGAYVNAGIFYKLDSGGSWFNLTVAFDKREETKLPNNQGLLRHGAPQAVLQSAEP